MRRTGFAAAAWGVVTLCMMHAGFSAADDAPRFTRTEVEIEVPEVTLIDQRGEEVEFRELVLADKPVYVISTRGGNYGDGDPENPNPADFQSGYLRHILGFMGLKDVRIIAANGMDMGPEPRAEGLAEANGKIDSAISALAA